MGIRATHPTRSARFLREGLGLIELRRGRMGHGGIWLRFGDRTSHPQLELNRNPKGSPYATPTVPGESPADLGMRVNDRAAAGKRLVRAGAKRVHEIRDGEKVVLARYEGPDAHWIELIDSPGL